jgi:putative transposase
MAVNQQCPAGARGQGLALMSDNGCQPTSLACVEACSTLGIHQAFTSYNDPKGNVDTERLTRTLKMELSLCLNQCPGHLGRHGQRA